MHSRYTMRQTRVTPDITRSTKLQGAQHSPKLAFKNMDFCVTENLIFLALTSHGVKRKRSTKRLKHTRNLFRKNLQLIGIC